MHVSLLTATDRAECLMASPHAHRPLQRLCVGGHGSSGWSKALETQPQRHVKSHVTNDMKISSIALTSSKATHMHMIGGIDNCIN